MKSNVNVPDTTSYQALIFDLDGTLIDSMPTHNLAWSQTLEAYGYTIDESLLHKWAGISSFDTVKIMNKHFGWSLDPLDVSKEKENIYKKKMLLVKLSQPVLEVVRANYGKKKLGIVTGGESTIVNQVLAAHDIKSLFSVIVCADDTSRGKQFPDPFLLASQKLGIPQSKCLYFDDGDVGLQGAQSAKMKTIKVNLRKKEIFIFSEESKVITEVMSL